MFGRTTTRARGGDWTASAIDAIRPYVQHAMNDPELRETARRVIGIGAQLSQELDGKGFGKGARMIATDRKLQRQIGEAAQALGDGAVNIADGGARERRRSGLQRIMAAFGLLTLAGLGAAFLMRRFRGGAMGVEDAMAAARQNGGAVASDPVRPAGSPMPS